MSGKYTAVNDALHDYLVEHAGTRDDVLRRLELETDALGEAARMQVAPDQGAFLTVLTSAIGARRAVEAGTFTGYSAICIARGLGAGGRLVTCELDAERAAIARRHIDAAGVADRVEVRVGPAAETIPALDDAAPLDLGFIDADKLGYLTYYELIVERLRPGGLVVLDNVLWGGAVVDEADDSEETRAIREVNAAVRDDDRVDSAMIAVADGLLLAYKRHREPDGR